MSLDIRICTHSIVGVDSEEPCIEWESDFTVGVLHSKGVKIWFKQGVSVLFDGRENKDIAPRSAQILTDVTKISHQVTHWCPENGQFPYMEKTISLTFKSYQNMLELLQNRVESKDGSVILRNPKMLADTLGELEVITEDDECIKEYSRKTVDLIRQLSSNIVFVSGGSDYDLAFGFQKHNLAAVVHELQDIYNRYTKDICSIEKSPST